MTIMIQSFGPKTIQDITNLELDLLSIEGKFWSTLAQTSDFGVVNAKKKQADTCHSLHQYFRGQ